MTAEPMTPVRSRPWALIICAVIGVLLLTTLGGWQLYRLQWKQNLIANIESGLESNPITLFDAEAGLEHGFDVEWLRVRASGVFRHDLERHVYAIRDKRPGWLVITPLVKRGDYIVLVNRGFVPEDRKDLSTRPEPDADEVEITGFVRVEPDRKNSFTPETDRANNRWYWFDLIGIGSSLPDEVWDTGDDTVMRGVPFAIQQEPFEISNGYRGPVPAKVSPNLRNNHLGYAVTWFSLAIILAVMTILYIRRRSEK